MLRCTACGHEAAVAVLDTAPGEPIASAAPDPDRDRSGESVGPYRLEERLGAGGMGVVYRARREGDEASVALKLLKPVDSKLREQFAARFRREGAALDRLSHPNIVALLDRGEHEGTAYLVTELVSGQTLAERLTMGPLPVETVTKILPRIAEAIAYAHRQGVIHRDLKPGNVILDGDEPKLLDFGLARITGTDTAAETLTRTNLAMGTLNYLAPEQREDARRVDQRADVFSLGVMLYEMLTGRVPMGSFDPPSKRRPGIDPRWDAVVGRCLRDEPDERYPNMDVFLAELPMVLAPARMRRRWLLALGVALGVAGLAGAGLLLVGNRVWRSPERSASSTTSTGTLTSPSDSAVRPVPDAREARRPFSGLDAKTPEPPDAEPRPRPADAGAQPAPSSQKLPGLGGWVRVRAGTFFMGSPTTEAHRGAEETRHRVTLRRDFWIKSTPVTQAEYEAWMGYNPAQHQGCASCPAERISWHEAAAYTNALSDAEKRPRCYDCTGQEEKLRCSLAQAFSTPYDCPGYRLPTEAEWERAARAGSAEAGYGPANEVGWFASNSERKTHPVGGKKPNGAGLYDLLGNTFEWCHDWYARYSPYSATDPTGPVKGTHRVGRGGCWSSPDSEARFSFRGFGSPTNRDYRLGFRPVRTHVPGR